MFWAWLKGKLRDSLTAQDKLAAVQQMCLKLMRTDVPESLCSHLVQHVIKLEKVRKNNNKTGKSNLKFCAPLQADAQAEGLFSAAAEAAIYPVKRRIELDDDEDEEDSEDEVVVDDDDDDTADEHVEYEVPEFLEEIEI